MKYFCRSRDDLDYMGFGDTPEKAYADLQQSWGGTVIIDEIDWYELTPVKATMTISVTKPTIKKATK